MKREEILKVLLEDLERIPLARTSYEELKKIAAQMHFEQVDQFLSKENLKLKVSEIPYRRSNTFNSVDNIFIYICLAAEFGKSWQSSKVLELTDNETHSALVEFVGAVKFKNLDIYLKNFKELVNDFYGSIEREEILQLLIEDLEKIPLARTSYEELKEIAAQMHFEQMDKFLSKENLKLKVSEIPYRFNDQFSLSDNIFIYIGMAAEFGGKFWKNKEILDLSDVETTRNLYDFSDTFRINNPDPSTFADICFEDLKKIFFIYYYVIMIDRG